jgi:photosystem II stability/assembly factor-like uncharacterized protein
MSRRCWTAARRCGTVPDMRSRLGLVALPLLLSLPLLAAPAVASPAAQTAAPTAAASNARGEEPRLAWRQEVVDADQSFRGLDAVDRRTAWITGASLTDGGDAKVYRTTDAGRSWQDVSPPRTAGLSFRDVEATGSGTASVLAIGEGKASRIYRTTNGGRTWTETFRNTEPAAFYNCMDFYPGGRRGLAVSDPVDGHFRIAATRDAGRSWTVLPDTGMPDSTGEFNFSASGDCLVISGREAWFGSGGAAARVFRSRNHGRTWSASDSTIPAGEAAGVFGLAFRDPDHGIAVGGDFEAPEDGVDATARTRDGRSWTGAGDLAHLGEDAAWSRGRLLVVGESGEVGGSSVSTDGGRTWERFSRARFHTLDCTDDGSCWAAGGDGRTGRLRLARD